MSELVNAHDIQLREVEETPSFNKETLRALMTADGFTQEMVDLVIIDLEVGDMRYYIGDTSGSMGISDGNIYNIYDGETTINSTRFDEMMQSLKRSYKLCSRAGIHSQFISFVDDQPLIVNKGNNDLLQLDRLFDRLFFTPSGGTPLLAQLHKVIVSLRSLPMNSAMRRKVIIFSDGCPSDGTNQQIVEAFKEISKYNASITVRLCTSGKNVIQYWENIDKQTELNLDIIDDFAKEKRCVVKNNKNLKYKYSLHMLREFGMYQNQFDRMDECKLTELDIRRINDLYGPQVEACCVIS